MQLPLPLPQLLILILDPAVQLQHLLSFLPVHHRKMES